MITDKVNNMAHRIIVDSGVEWDSVDYWLTLYKKNVYFLSLLLLLLLSYNKPLNTDDVWW